MPEFYQLRKSTVLKHRKHFFTKLRYKIHRYEYDMQNRFQQCFKTWNDVLFSKKNPYLLSIGKESVSRSFKADLRLFLSPHYFLHFQLIEKNLCLKNGKLCLHFGTTGILLKRRSHMSIESVQKLIRICSNGSNDCGCLLLMWKLFSCHSLHETFCTVLHAGEVNNIWVVISAARLPTIRIGTSRWIPTFLTTAPVSCNFR